MSKKADSTPSLGENIFCVVRNIPREYGLRDLRRHFSSFVETGKFTVFHFLGRTDNPKAGTLCCPVLLHNVPEFAEAFNGRPWTADSGTALSSSCTIGSGKDLFHDWERTEGGEAGEAGPHGPPMRTRRQLREEASVPRSGIPELHPPLMLEHGNVGTPTEEVIERIRECRIPPSVLKRLGISLVPRTAEIRLDYGAPLESVEGEEWDRHVARHPLPEVSYERADRLETENMLYEEPVELLWEKGGSGLVFHTDAAYWEQQRGGFDEITSDDWDVDVRDHEFLHRSAAQRYAGLQPQQELCSFERHTRGLGSAILRAQGWEDGSDIGRGVVKQRIPQPHQAGKAGLGYKPRQRLLPSGKRNRQDSSAAISKSTRRERSRRRRGMAQ